MVSPAHRLSHLARRFVGSLSPAGPSVADEAWVASVLGAGELALWRRMTGPDRRHAVSVADRVGRDSPAEVVAAALLHDVGKVEAGLGTWGRVPATVVSLVARERAVRGRGRIARYLRHDVLGAALLADAGAHPLTIAWAREHHLPPTRWTVPQEWATRLKAADDD